MSVPDRDCHAERGASFSEATPQSRAPEDHSHIALALARFERRVARSGFARRLNRAWVTCALLTLAAFVGALSLAHYPFVTPEAEPPITIASRAAELMYLPPPGDAGAAFAGFRRAGAVQLTAASVAGFTTSASATASNDLPPAAEPRGGDGDSPSDKPDTLDLQQLAGTWGDAVRFASARERESAFPPTSPAQHGFAALELSAIPEPSTGFVVGAGLAALLVWSHYGRRRTRLGAR